MPTVTTSWTLKFEQATSLSQKATLCMKTVGIVKIFAKGTWIQVDDMTLVTATLCYLFFRVVCS